MADRFEVRAANAQATDVFQHELGLPHFIAQTMASRGIETLEQAHAFLNPSLERDWGNPYDIPGLEEVVDALEAAVRRGDHIVVFGDFDLDGISATTVLTRGLREMGALATPFIPRRFDEGYGLTDAALQRVMQLGPRPDFIVTVDCGISCRETVDAVLAQGIQVAITDHHEPGEAIPVGVPLVDPKAKGPAEDAILAGVGVALKVVQALGGRFGLPYLWREYTDFATLGTVADLMPMVGENRALVADGIRRMNEYPRPCVAALLAQAGVTDPLSATNLSFSLAPRLNAAGRMGDAMLACDLLLSDDIEQAQRLAAALEEVNTRRRSTEAELAEIAKVQAEETYQGQRVLVVAGAGWHEGVKGIVASRLVGMYGVPTLLFTIEGDEARGSGRSVGSVNLFKAVESTSDILTRFGGHAAAVGVTVPTDKLPEFTARLNAYMENLPEDSFHPSMRIDAPVSLSELTIDTVAQLDLLAPFGQENPVPCFLAHNVTLANHRAVGSAKNHFSCTLTDGTAQAAAIMFHANDIDSLLSTDSVVDAAFTLQIDVWRGRKSVKAMLKALSPARSCAALEACLTPEELSLVAELYDAQDSELSEGFGEQLEAAARYVSELEQNRATWERLALESPTSLRAAVVHAIIGNSTLHESQRAILDALERGESLLSVMATGRGKSLTFQVNAALMALRHGRASVFVYPLRALIADQAYHLDGALYSLGISSATLTGESTPQERARIFDDLAHGAIDIILTTPEFLDYHVDAFARSGRIGFVAIDEAHHVGQAKAGARPSYRSLGRVLQALGNPVVLALTATASDAIARDIRETLGLSSHVYDDTARPNLHLDDRRDLRNRDDYLAHIVARGEKTIVYVSSREQSVALARELRKRVPQLATRIGFYNAGLSRAERNGAEELFRSDAFCVLVATSAFGEGVNIPHIRRVVLYSLPFNEVEFNQMSGRAGRDGNPAVIHLLYGKGDVQTNERVLYGATPDRATLADVYRYLRARQAQTPTTAFVVDLDEFGPQAKAPASNEPADASVEMARKLTPGAVKCGLEVFRELGLIKAHRACFSHERLWSVAVRPNADHVELTSSVRYREGMSEIDEFNSFRAWALQSAPEELLAHITHPIIPDA